MEEVLSHWRPDGIADAMELALSRARGRVEASERAAVAAEIGEAVRRSCLGRAEFAAQIGHLPVTAIDLCLWKGGCPRPALGHTHGQDKALGRPGRCQPRCSSVEVEFSGLYAENRTATENFTSQQSQQSQRPQRSRIRVALRRTKGTEQGR